jgi:SAM-dependent methyltransferase
VADYLRARPGYPEGLLELLATRCGLAPGHDVADIGSGTGILSRPFLERGHRVWGVEPNAEMRRAGERYLAGYERFVSVDGRAEDTTLATDSVDLVAAGQAFHWFVADLARVEFLRILRPCGHVVLVWNDRDQSSGPFMREYERLLATHGTDYRRVHHRRFGESEIGAFYGGGGFECATLTHRQVFDREGLRARMRSSSYVPAPGQTGHESLMADLDRLFDRHAVEGRVLFPYRTRVYWGRPAICR